MQLAAALQAFKSFSTVTFYDKAETIWIQKMCSLLGLLQTKLDVKCVRLFGCLR